MRWEWRWRQGGGRHVWDGNVESEMESGDYDLRCWPSGKDLTN